MTQAIQKRLPLDNLDASLIAYEMFSDLMIQLEMVFEAPLDSDRLTQAALLTLLSEPKLGCRLVNHWRKPYWQKVTFSKEQVFTSASSQAEYDEFKKTPPHPYSGPQMRICLFNASRNTQLLVKVSHQAADAAGVKDICRLLASSYSALATDRDYRPEIHSGQSTDCQYLVNLVPKKDRRALKKQHMEYTRLGRIPCSTFKLPFEGGPNESLSFLQRTVSDPQIEALKDYGKKHNATLNDLFLSAFFRAQAQAGNWDGQRQLALNMTVDFRKHLPENQASKVTNLSIPLKYWPCLENDLGNDFSDTLSKITAATRRRKQSYFGLDFLQYVRPFVRYFPHFLSHAGIRQEVRKEQKLDNWADTFTNMGPIKSSVVWFDSKPVRAHLLPPSKYPPYFILGVSGYEGAVTFSISAYNAQKELSLRFLDALVNELRQII